MSRATGWGITNHAGGLMPLAFSGNHDADRESHLRWPIDRGKSRPVSVTIISNEDKLRIVTDQELADAKITRDQLDMAVLKVGCMFWNGNSRQRSLKKLGLMEERESTNVLTAKGKLYLYAMVGRRFGDVE